MDMTTISTHSRARRAVAAASALAIGLLGAVGIAGAASADPIDGVGNIQASRSGQAATSIVVHKYEKTAANGTAGTTGAQTGVELPGAPGGAEPVVGANFTVTPVLYEGDELDLTTNAGWQRAAAAQAAFTPSTATFSDADFTLGTASTPVPTNASGVATFGSLEFGLYLVRETTPLVDGVISPALPFLVTVPFPTGADHPTNPNEWLYTVHAYPKNAVTGVVKTVNSGDTAFLTEGDYLSWDIAAEVPILAQGGSLTSFVISDTVVDDQLDFVTSGLPTGISDWNVAVTDADGDPVAVTEGTDYAITTPITASTTKVSVTFTTAGLATLAASAQGGQVVFTVPTKVVAVPEAGTIANDAELDVNNAHLEDSASTDFGQLRVLKYAETDTGDTPTKTPLQGASFALYVDLDADGVVDTGELAAGNRVSSAGIDEWESNASGLLDIPALKGGKYFLVETAAPLGYKLDATPRPIEITAGLSNADAPAVNYLEIENDQVPPWLLPFTGGNGVLTFTLAGAGLMALALGFAFLAARRRKQATQH